MRRLVGGMLVRNTRADGRVVIQPGVPGQHRPNVRRMPSMRPRTVLVCASHGLVRCQDRITTEWKGW